MRDADQDETEKNNGENGAHNGSGEPTMESWFSEQENLSRKLSERQVVWVKVIQVTAEHVLVDIGEKNEGMIPISEFEKSPAVGDRVPVIAGARKGPGSRISHKAAKESMAWEGIVKAFKEKARVRGRVESAVKGGFVVDVGGADGFLPQSLADLYPVHNPERLLKTGVRCHVIELDEKKRRFVLSRKSVLLEEKAKRQEELLGQIKVGDVRIGRVARVQAQGLTVDIGGIEGFARASDLAWGKVSAPTQKKGDKLRVKVLAVPAKEEVLAGREHILLGVKQLSANPADAIKRKYPPKTIVKGPVVEATERGVLFSIDARQKAFCPAHELDGPAPKVGETVSAVVQGVDETTLNLLASIAKYAQIEDRKKIAQYLKPPKPLTLGQLLSPESEEEGRA